MDNRVILAIIILSVALLSYPASAESGTITITNSTFAVYSHALNFANTADWTELNLDADNYSNIVSIFINMTGSNVKFATPGKSTTFTITACGTGGGTASYSNTSNATAWYFNNPSTFTCSPVTLAYTSPIFDDLTLTGFTGTTLADLNTTTPAYFGTAGSTNFLYGNSGQRWIYQTDIQSEIDNDYSITYQTAGGSQLFTTAITKVGVTNLLTKVRIENATGAPLEYPIQGDFTFNNNDWSVVNVYGQGIALNASAATGDYERIVINTSGSGLAPVTPPNSSNPNAANCPVNCINTSKTTYNNTESVNIYGSFYPANTTVTECLFFGFICEDKTINTESTTGYVFISTQGSTSPIKFLSFLTDQHNNYNQFTDLDIGTYQAQLYGFAAPGSTCTNGIVYDFPFIPLGCYYPHNITSFSVVNASGNLSIVWQTKLSNSSAIYGDTITVAWQNVTANDTVAIYDMNGTLAQFYNINQSTVSQIPVFIPLYTIGTWNATIFNGSNILHNATAFLNVLPPGAVDVNNSFGITMYWSKATDVINTPTQLNWNTGTYTGFYNISILLDGKEVRRTAFTGAPGQAQQASYSFNVPGAYIAQFMDINDTVQQQATIRIANTISQGGQPAVPTGSDAATSMGNNLLIFMSQPAFWGVILWFVVVVIVAVNKQNAGVIGLVFAAVEAVIGLFDPYRWYVLVIVIVILGILFMAGKKTTSEG